MAEWSFCLQSRKGRKIAKLSCKASTHALYKLGADSFQDTISSLKYGFPPKLLPNKEDVTLDGLLQNQERLQVEFDSKTSNSNNKSIKMSDKGNIGRRPKRAAAVAATQAMPDVIKAQEEQMKAMSSSSPSKKRSRTLDSTNRKPPPPRFTAAAGDGRRLADGATVVNPRRKKSKNILERSKTSSDMSEALLGALNDRGKMGVVLRKGMKNAVQASYETSRAFSRLAAIQAKSYQLQVLGEEASSSRSSSSSSSSATQRLKITYQGTVDKTKQEELVDCIPRDILEAVIRGIYASNQEALRAENLALLSPRVLWSLVHVIPNTPDVGECYKALLPELNWSFLRRRAQQLSEKAKENLRQEQEADGEHETASMDLDKGQEAIAAVEHAMEHLHEHERAERSSKQASAALARLQQQTHQEREWKLITPEEPDRDELRECIMEAPPDQVECIPSIITKVMKICHIHNWRELANVTDPTRLTSVLDDVSIDQISKWIEKAQGESVDEIMVEICDGEVEHVQALTTKARTGTPKDLAGWRLIPEMLQDNLKDEGTKPTLTQLTSWSQRAHRLLQEYEWLNWYATPVE